MDLNSIKTEQRNSRTAQIDTMSTLSMVKLINEEDKKVAAAVGDEAEHIAQAVDVIAAQLKQGGRLVYSGCGTSGRLGVLDAVECPPTYSTDPGEVIGLIAGGNEAIFRAKEGAEDDEALGAEDLKKIGFGSKDVLVGIAASGRTPYVLGAMNYARQQGAHVIGISCNPGSQDGKDGGDRHYSHPRPGGGHRFHPDEERHRPEDGAEYAFHRRDDQAGQGLRQPDGGREAYQRQAGGAVQAHRL